MLAEMMLRSDEEGRGVIQLTVPSANTIKVAEAIRGVLSLAGHKVRRVNSEGEEIVSADEVFPDGCPAMALRLTKGNLPFGCHYWSKGNVWKAFWHRYIPFDPEQDRQT